jgi:acetate kinase
MIDRIGLDASNISYKTNADSIEESMSIANHKIGLEKIAALLMDKTGVINSTQDIDVVGHRVVHGGASFSNPVHVDEMVEEKITAFQLAPLTIQRTWKEFTSLQLFYIGKTNGCF